MTSVPRPLRRVAALLVAAAAAAAISAPAASAGVLVQSATGCDNPALEQPFLRWIDPASYVLAPDGGVENGADGWSLSGASVVSGNEGYYVRDASDSKSLSLPSGSSATSPAQCVGLGHPTLRFFAKRTSGNPFGSVKVEVLFEDAGGNAHSLTIGNTGAGSSFAPTVQMAIVANLLPLLPNEQTAVAFRFTPQGGANFQIDDVYVDPWKR